MWWQTILETVVPSIVSSLKTTTAETPAPTTVTAKPDDAVKALQGFLNTALQLNPPLKVDGWLGPKTDAAIMAGLAKLTPYLSLLR